MFKHQLLMAPDEARVDSRQCFLKSLPIMPFLLHTCVDTYAYAPNLVAQAKGVDLLVQCISVGSRELEAAFPEYVNRFYEYLANPETAGRILTQTMPRDAVFSHISLYSREAIGRATEEEINARLRAGYDGRFVIGQDLMSFTLTPQGVIRTPYNIQVRQEEPSP